MQEVRGGESVQEREGGGRRRDSMRSKRRDKVGRAVWKVLDGRGRGGERKEERRREGDRECVSVCARVLACVLACVQARVRL